MGRDGDGGGKPVNRQKREISHIVIRDAEKRGGSIHPQIVPHTRNRVLVPYEYKTDSKPIFGTYIGITKSSRPGHWK